MPESTPLVSIIIPAYNAAGTLYQCLSACKQQTHAHVEVIVVDDGSTDATPDIAQGMEGVRYIHQRNAGPAAARNRGASAAEGAYLAFTDADCVPHADWLEKLLPHFEECVGAVGGTYGIANPEHLLARLVHQEIQMRHARLARNVDFLGSFNVAYRAEVFEALNGFDTTFHWASGEDNDLAYRTQDAGWDLRFTGEAVVDHYHPMALEPYLQTQMRHGFWRMKLYAKHPRRATSGDRYAGPIALAAPAAALGLLALFLFTFVVGWWLPFEWLASLNAAFCACYGVFLLLHLPLAWRVTRGWRWLETPYFVLLSTCRDFARAVGLAWGVWHFQMRRRN